MEENVLPKPRKSIYTCFIKRLLDISLSLFAIVILMPVYTIIAVLELFFHGSPVLYTVERPGKDEKLFKIYKFRSMTNERDETGALLPEEKRLTRFGKFLRRTSLDEIPEFFCILKGDMSIIGPRPLLIEYLSLYSPRYKARHSVRPGLACVPMLGAPQKNTWTWRDQFENDIYYVEHVSFLVDVKTVLSVALYMLRRNEVRTDDTRIPFDGSNYDETGTKDKMAEERKPECVI